MAGIYLFIICNQFKQAIQMSQLQVSERASINKQLLLLNIIQFYIIEVGIYVVHVLIFGK